MTGGSALVIGDDTRSFLTIVRSLGRRGIAVHAAPANFRAPALRSRYISAIHHLPPWIGDGETWLSAVSELLRAQRYDLVIPCNETALLPLHWHRATLSRFARLAIPEDRAVAVLFDKYETRKLAQRVGVPIAGGRLLHSGDTAEGLLAEFGSPIVVKPRRSYSLQQLATRGKVEVVRQRARLERLIGELDPAETLIEQYFGGQGIGISLLASRGRVLQAFEHHRVRELAGASFYRHSAPLSRDLAAACEAIVAALAYTGLAMFEFKRNSDNAWILLEVNARPWGSMPLPVALGIDFPYWWYRLLTTGEERPAIAYRTGVYGRNLLPDLQDSLAEARMRQLGSLATAGFLMRRTAEMTRVLTGTEVHDVLTRDDPGPGLEELRGIARAVGRRVGGAMPGAPARRRGRAHAQLRALRAATARTRVVFVCMGNICRSPFAAALLRTRRQDAEFAIESAGMIARPGRPTPEYGCEAAAAHGIDLSEHRSIWLSAEMAEAASLLIVFDKMTRAAVLDRYPQLTAPVISLGDFAGIGDIADPVDGGPAEFQRIYNQIAAAVAELAALL